MSLPPEEEARAGFYNLLARLFYAPPDGALLQSLATAPDIQAEDGELASSWKSLKEVAANTDPESVRDEYDTVFVGTGKSPVTLYACAYSIRYSSDTPLAALRGDLMRLGLGRREGVNEPEDHIATLCDTMRHLIGVQGRDLGEQRAFFMRWIAPSCAALCDAIEAEPQTAFYKPVARFAKVFFDIERTAFELH
jgi:TorA maturation chaperone TorD